MADKPPPDQPAPDTFPVVRDVAVAFCRQVLILDVEVLEVAIRQGEHALAAAPILDPTLAIKASAELEEQLTLLRAVLVLRRTLERFRPQEQSRNPGTQEPQTPGATP